MICIVHTQSNIKIDIKDGRISVLVIENPIMMRDLLTELGEQSQGGAGGFVLSVDYEPVPVNKNLILVKDPLHINCNEKKILTKIYQNIADEEKTIYHPERDNFEKAYLVYMKELCLLSPLPLVYDEKLSLEELLKCAHVLIEHSTGSFAEDIWHYIKVMSDLLSTKVFVFVNLKCYMSTEELDLLYQQCSYEQKSLLLIESHDTPPHPDEKKYIVDSDGCMIYY